MRPGKTPSGAKPSAKDQTRGKAKPNKTEKETPDEPPFFLAPKYTFVLQFCWQERLLTERLRQRQQEQLQPQAEPQPTDQQEQAEQPEQPPGQQPAQPDQQPAQPAQPAATDNKVAAATTKGA